MEIHHRDRGGVVLCQDYVLASAEQGMFSRALESLPVPPPGEFVRWPPTDGDPAKLEEPVTRARLRVLPSAVETREGVAPRLAAAESQNVMGTAGRLLASLVCRHEGEQPLAHVLLDLRECTDPFQEHPAAAARHLGEALAHLVGEARREVCAQMRMAGGGEPREATPMWWGAGRVPPLLEFLVPSTYRGFALTAQTHVAGPALGLFGAILVTEALPAAGTEEEEPALDGTAAPFSPEDELFALGCVSVLGQRQAAATDVEAYASAVGGRPLSSERVRLQVSLVPPLPSVVGQVFDRDGQWHPPCYLCRTPSRTTYLDVLAVDADAQPLWASSGWMKRVLGAARACPWLERRHEVLSALSRRWQMSPLPWKRHELELRSVAQQALQEASATRSPRSGPLERTRVVLRDSFRSVRTGEDMRELEQARRGLGQGPDRCEALPAEPALGRVMLGFLVELLQPQTTGEQMARTPRRLTVEVDLEVRGERGGFHETEGDEGASQQAFVEEGSTASSSSLSAGSGEESGSGEEDEWWNSDERGDLAEEEEALGAIPAGSMVVEETGLGALYALDVLQWRLSPLTRTFGMPMNVRLRHDVSPSCALPRMRPLHRLADAHLQLCEQALFNCVRETQLASNRATLDQQEAWLRRAGTRIPFALPLHTGTAPTDVLACSNEERVCRRLEDYKRVSGNATQRGVESPLARLTGGRKVLVMSREREDKEGVVVEEKELLRDALEGAFPDKVK